MSFNNKDISRDVQDELFRHPDEGDLESLFHQAIETLEETNFCDFEVQYEMLHNAVHELVGGAQKYGMSTLEYSAFDPFFMVHHASIDRIWVIWQELQKLRHKPFAFARCARRTIYKPLEPFSYDSVNTDPVTKANSKPVQAFEKSKFHYWYDSLDLNGHNVAELNDMINSKKQSNRIFAGVVLSGLKNSASVSVDLVASDGSLVHVGAFYVLGGEAEMPWAYERIYKMDMTDAARKINLAEGEHFQFQITAKKYDGTPLQVNFPAPVIIKRQAGDDHDILVLPLTKTNQLPAKVVVRKGTRIVFHAQEASVTDKLRELGSYTTSLQCAIPPGDANAYLLDTPYTLEPGDYYFTPDDSSECLEGSRIQISVDNE